MSLKHTRYCLTLVIVSALLLSVSLAVAQGAGTPNVKSAEAYTGPTLGFADVRFWDGDDNETLSGGFQGKLGNNSEATITLLDLDAKGEDPINGIVRLSSLQILAVDAKWEWASAADGGIGVAFNPGMEIATTGLTGANTSTRAWAEDDSFIPTLSLPLQYNTGRMKWFVQPKVAWFDTQIPTSLGTRLKGFGTVVGIGLGMRWQLGSKVSLFGDYTPIVDGYNTVDHNTNKVDDQAVWGAGLTYKLGNANTLSFFGTTAAGCTTATSLLAAPDDSVSFGVKLDRDL